MNETFRAMLEVRLADYHAWRDGRPLCDGRLVQYCGVEFVGAVSLPVDGAEAQIAGALSEGFAVGWAEHQGRLYLRVWEGGPEPGWPHVFAERRLADVDAMMRPAGFDV